MRTRDARARALALGVAVALASSCASNPTPAGRKVTQEEAISSGKGAYALVRYDNDGEEGGELIEASERQLLLLDKDQHLIEIDRRRLAELTLGVHDNHTDVIAAWGALGSVSTISHGFFLVLTFPIWLATSISATSQESHRGLFHCPADTPETSRTLSMPQCLASAGAYARFPQGLPPGVGAEQLLGRAPVVVPPAPPRPSAPPPASAPSLAPAPAQDGGAAEMPPPPPSDKRN